MWGTVGSTNSVGPTSKQSQIVRLSRFHLIWRKWEKSSSQQQQQQQQQLVSFYELAALRRSQKQNILFMAWELLCLNFKKIKLEKKTTYFILICWNAILTCVNTSVVVSNMCEKSMYLWDLVSLPKVKVEKHKTQSLSFSLTETRQRLMLRPFSRLHSKKMHERKQHQWCYNKPLPWQSTRQKAERQDEKWL